MISTIKIIKLLSLEYLNLVIIANILAWPIAWIIVNRLFQHFAYKTDIGLWIFLLAGVMAFAVALITIGYQAIKAAVANPVDSPRYE